MLYKNQNVLLTGHRGYIGSALHKALIKEGATVSILDDNIMTIPNWSRYLINKDVVFHLAAETSLQKSEDYPGRNYRENVEPVLKICSNKAFKGKLILAGTVTQVGLTDTDRTGSIINDFSRCFPQTIYDVHKQMAEMYAAYYGHTTLRLANVYGPGVYRDDKERNVISRMILNALRGDPIFVYRGGYTSRDFIYIDDVVNAFLEAGTKPDLLPMGYIIATGRSVTFRELALMIEKEVGGTTIEYVDQEVEWLIDARTVQFQKPTFFQRSTLWRPTITLEKGIKLTVKHLEETLFSL